jgi:transcription elongation factor Elf1
MQNHLNYPKKFSCPVCGELCEVKNSKKEKPYYFCDSCGVQVFIRGKDGVNRFMEFVENDELFKTIKDQNAFSNSQVLKLNKRINLIKIQISNLKAKVPIFGSDGIKNQINELNRKLLELEDQYIQSLTNH